MATNYSDRIQRVNARRNGTSPDALTKGLGFTESAAPVDSVVQRYQSKTKSKNFQFALVSMQEVDARYTAISYREAERVAKQLDTGLANSGKDVKVELQGSLPLNVHLRRISDVDMLVWPDESFFVFDSTGPLAHTYTPSSRDTASEILTLRTEAREVLRSAFPAARVDDSGAKCITMSEGSLLRNVDVVPSVLFKTAIYQQTGNEEDRGVQIYDKKRSELTKNLPFKVRSLVNEKDALTGGGCKKAIRLLKNMKEDADEEIALSSFDLMSLVYAIPNSDLMHQVYYEGKIVASLQAWFLRLTQDEAYLRNLNVVDGSRKIARSAGDVSAVGVMASELNMLILHIARELHPEVASTYDAWREKVSNEFLI